VIARRFHWGEISKRLQKDSKLAKKAREQDSSKSNPTLSVFASSPSAVVSDFEINGIFHGVRNQKRNDKLTRSTFFYFKRLK
jgi:hypothetical protein